MPVAPSFTDLLAQFEAEALTQRATLQFTDGDITEAQAHGAGAMGDAAIRFGVQSFKETFLDGAEDDALTALVDDHINIQRSPATPSQAAVAFSRTSGGAGGTISTGFQIGSAFDAAGNTVVFTVDADVVFPGASNGPIAGTVTAVVLGRASNVVAGTITRIVGVPFDTTVTVTNAVAAGGGNDEESDDELRVRARTFWTTLRRGTLAALEYGALLVSSVRIAKAIEDAVTGLVTLVVSDSDGNSTAQMISDARAEVENWRAAGSIITVAGGTPLVVDITGTLTVIAGVDRAVLAPFVIDAITAHMLKLRQGEVLYLDEIKAAGINVDPDSIRALPLTLPLTDTTPLSYQVIRPGTISIA